MNEHWNLHSGNTVRLTEGEKVIVKPATWKKINQVSIITIQWDEYEIAINLTERHPQDVLDEFNGNYKDKTIRTILSEINQNSQSNEKQFLLKIVKGLFPGTDYVTFFDSMDFQDQIIFLGLLSLFSSSPLVIIQDYILNLLSEEQSRVLLEYISESNRTFILISERKSDYWVFKHYEKYTTPSIKVDEPLPIWLSMIVGNERKHTEKILELSRHFDNTVILDTWSTDGTYEILKQGWLKILWPWRLHSKHNSLVDVRNLSVELNPSEWRLILDADEEITPWDIDKLKNIRPGEDTTWIIIPWKDYRYWEGLEFTDWKTALIKRWVLFEWLAHACPQIWIRNRWESLIWADDVAIKHFPVVDTELIQKKVKYYLTQLFTGVEKQPHWLRYYWFIGYTYFKNSDTENAKKYFSIITKRQHWLFPAETIQSYLILIAILYNEGNYSNAEEILNAATSYINTQKNDDEIKGSPLITYLEELRVIFNEKIPQMPYFNFWF